MNPPVIYYHKIDKPDEGSLVRGGFTPLPRFIRQMKYLKQRGFVSYTATEIVEYFREHGKFPLKSITVTFDDGWEDNYINAFPVLKEFGIKATLFIVPGCIGQASTKAVADGEPPRQHLSREQIVEMSRHGIEIGSHTLNHRLLTAIPTADIENEVFEAKRQLEDIVQKPCLTFAYPAGFFCREAQQIVEKAGHIAAFTTTYGPHDHCDIFAINRTEILRRDRFLFQFDRKLRSLDAC